jgi:DNA replication protein DnaC
LRDRRFFSLAELNATIRALLDELNNRPMRGWGASYDRIQRSLTGVQLLILDDWGLEPLDAGARRNLYEILEERYGRRSTILTSQIPVDKRHAFIGGADDLMMPPSSKELCVVLVFSTQRSACWKG